MWFIWMPVGLILLASKRYVQKNWKLMHWVHAFFGCIVLWVTIYESCNVYSHNGWFWNMRHNTVPDNTVALLSILVCISGIVTQSVMAYYRGDKPWSKTEVVTPIGRCHRIFGYIMLFVGNLACALGTENYIKYFMAGKDMTNPGFVSLFIFCATILVIEIAHRIYRRRSYMKLGTPETVSYKDKNKIIKFYTPK